MTEIKKIFITGASGLLGSNLAFYFRDRAAVTGQFFKNPVNMDGVDMAPGDLRSYENTRDILVDLRPDIVIHCASRTDVDGIEADREGGWQANVLTTQVLLDALRDSPAKLVYISTDSVYPGVGAPHTEKASCRPCNWYGQTKLEGEGLVKHRENALILRTNLFGWNIRDKESLAEWFLNRLSAGGSVNGFIDAQFSSIYTFSLARLIDECLEQDVSGLYNCACRDSWTKYEFGRQIAQLFGYRADCLQPVKMKTAGLKAYRGHDLSLDVKNLETRLGHPLPTMAESVRALHSDWRKNLPDAIKSSRGGHGCRHTYPSRKTIPYGSQAIDHNDIDAVVATLKSGYLTQGPMVPEFEQKVIQTVGAAFGIAVNSGTSALHAACLACGIGPGDEAITSPITFVASANCIAYCGGRPVFADIDPVTYNLSSEALEVCINKGTKAVIPVHFAGQSCDMAAIKKIVRIKEKQYGHKIYIIEDASHALGSFYREQPIGSCRYSDMAVFSFHPVKHITTGEGGLVTTNDSLLAERCRLFRSHGISKDPERMDQNPGPWYYEQQTLGYNYRMTDIQAALGLAQLAKLGWFTDRRRFIVDHYNDALSGLEGVTLPSEKSQCRSNFHLYVVKIDFEKLGKSRSEVMAELKAQGIHTQVHYIPVHLQPYYRRTGLTGLNDCPSAVAYYRDCLSLPLYPGMSNQAVEYVLHVFRKLFQEGRSGAGKSAYDQKGTPITRPEKAV